MGISPPAFSDGTTISAGDIRTRITEIEDFVNQGIVAGDYQTSSRWVESKHIYKPDFFGSPSPRMEAVSGDTHYRATDASRVPRAVFHGDLNTQVYLPIPGLCATIKNPYSQTLNASVVATFYAYESGGSLAAGAPNNTPPMETNIARFEMYLDGTRVDGTTRRLYNSSRNRTGSRMMARHQISMIALLNLSQGVHQFGVYAWIDKPGIEAVFLAEAGTDPGIAVGDPKWKHIFIQSRNLIVDVHALHA